MATVAETAKQIAGKTLGQATKFLLKRYPDFIVYKVRCKSPPKSFYEEPGCAIYPGSENQCVIATHPNWGAWAINAFIHGYKTKDIVMVRDIPQQKETYEGNIEKDFYPPNYFSSQDNSEKKNNLDAIVELKKEKRKNDSLISYDQTMKKKREEIKKYVRESIHPIMIKRAARMGEDYLDAFLIEDMDVLELGFMIPPLFPDNRDKRDKYAEQIFKILLAWNNKVIDELSYEVLEDTYSLLRLDKKNKIIILDQESYSDTLCDGFYFNNDRRLVLINER